MRKRIVYEDDFVEHVIIIGMAKPVDEQEECLKLVGLNLRTGSEAFLTRLALRLGFTSCLAGGKKVKEILLI